VSRVKYLITDLLDSVQSVSVQSVRVNVICSLYASGMCANSLEMAGEECGVFYMIFSSALCDWFVLCSVQTN